jgi:hypothetical protein
MRTPIIITAVAVLSSAAAGQSFNIEWGSPETAPPATYAAEGLAGVWNTFSSMPNFQRMPLVGLDGSPIAPDIMNIGFDVIESHDNPSTFGDNEALLDDCFTSFNDPIDGCLFIRFMEPGEYTVIMYAVAPDDDSLLSRLRIDQNTEDPELVGGQWIGEHIDGLSYMSQTATVGLDGRLDMHSGLPSANIRSVLNGIQVIAHADLCQPDFTGEGNLNFLDVSAFLSAFGSQDPSADFTGEGQFNFLDVSAFLAAFGKGCP